MGDRQSEGAGIIAPARSGFAWRCRSRFQLDQALRLKRDLPQLVVATLAGELISVEGVLFGGVGSAQKESLLERKARISVLDSEHSALAAERETLRKKRDQAKSAVDTALTQLEEARAKHRAADLARSTSGVKIALLEREAEEVARKIDSLGSEKSVLRQQIEAADHRVAQLETELSDSRKTFADEQTTKKSPIPRDAMQKRKKKRQLQS